MIDALLEMISTAFNSIIEFFYQFIVLITTPLAYLLEFLEGVFHFIVVLFEVLIAVLMIFVAVFQFLFALISGLFRTIKMWLTVQPNSNVSFKSASEQGFDTVVNILNGTGLLTVVPMVALAFLWLYFIIKMIGLIGGQIAVSPFGRGGN